MNNCKRNHIIITLYGLMIVTVFLGIGNIFGSSIDWLGQHSVFPEVFRQNFYQTGRIVSNFVFDIGGGQNVYNFAYYGFLSPFVLLSYLLPFVNMTAYTAAVSIIIYIATGNLVYRFIRHHFDDKTGLFAAVLFMSVSSIFIQYHRHIMYVWYLPFLILALMGLDRYFEKKRCTLFVISTVCIILTNYYFSVGCLIALFIYATYKILQNEEIKFKDFLKRFIETGLVFSLPVLICAFLLLPTAAALSENSRPYHIPITAKLLLVPQAKLVFYGIHSYGLTLAMFIAVLGNLSCKKIKKCDKFLNIVLLIMVLSPIIPFALNGMLYIRSKVMIPFVILYIYNFLLFMRRLKENTVAMKIPLILTGIFIGATFVLNIGEYLPSDFVWYVLAAMELFLFRALMKKPKRIYIYTLVVMVIGLVGGNFDNHYVPVDEYRALGINDVENMMQQADKGEPYRTNVAYKEEFNCNRTYGENFFGTSAYSSTPNKLYLDFYENCMGNNEQEINRLLVTGAKNELFYSFMGTRYTFAPNDPGFYHEKVAEGKSLNMYENKLAYPIVYKSKRLLDEKEFDNLEFPYTTETMMTHTVVKDSCKSDYKSVIKKHHVKSEYRFNTAEMPGFDEKKGVLKYDIDLGEKFRNKIVYLSFNLNNKGEFCNEEHLKITLNGICNTLSYDWAYYNDNTKFDYVIPMENTQTLSVEVSSGKYDIYDLKLYTSDIIYEEYTGAENIRFNKKRDSISATTEGKAGEYLVTSIPFDKGFSATVNGKSVPVEIVNKAFIGIRLAEGKNNVVLKYRSPMQNIGIFISLIGMLAFVAFILKGTIAVLFKKYKEILLYLIFGVLTTIVSIASYYLCTLLFLNPEIGVQLQVANVISWVLSVSFAYVTNKIFVFESRAGVVKELLKFASSRLGTLVMEMLLMYLMVTVWGLGDMGVKIFVQFIVIALNYILSKLIVFREGKK